MYMCIFFLTLMDMIHDTFCLWFNINVVILAQQTQ
jgi:hypothetical protein